MTAQLNDNRDPRPPETGWAQARHLRGKGVRTCLPAVESPGTLPHTDHKGADWNIVRGED